VDKKHKLHPVLSWKTIITEIKNLPKGAKIGYDLTEELKRDSTLGIIPIGYWHGYPRIYSGIGELWCNNIKIKIIGRVSMDIMVIDLTDVKSVKVGDEIILIKNSGEQYANTETVAYQSNTINYEIVTRINPLIKRFVK
jgi:alanine racemase